MVDPLCNVAAILVVIVGGCWTVENRIVVEFSTHRLDVSLGTWRACLVTDNETRRKLFGILADRNVCFVAKVDVGEVAWREVTFASWVAGVTRAIEIDPTIQFDPDLFR